MATMERDRATSSRPWFITRDLAGLALVSTVAVSAITVLSVLPRHENQAAPVSVSIPRTTASSAQKPATAPESLRLPADAVARVPLAASPAAVRVSVTRLSAPGGGGTVTGITPDGTAVGQITTGQGSLAVRWNVDQPAGLANAAPTALPAARAGAGHPGIGANGVIGFTQELKGLPVGRPAALVGGTTRRLDRVPAGDVVDVNAAGDVLVSQVSTAGMAQNYHGQPIVPQAGFVWSPSTNRLSRVSAPGAALLDDGSVLIQHHSGQPGQARADAVWHGRTTTTLAEPTGWTAQVAGGRSFRAVVGTLIRGAHGNAGTDPAVPQHAVLWHYGRLEVLPGLGGTAATATAATSKGVAVGAAQVPGGQPHAMRWFAGTGTDLGTLGGARSWASDIGGNGVVAGWSTTRNGVQHAAAWLPDGRIIDLGASLGAGVESSAQGVSGHRIYGSRTGPGGSLLPVVWTLEL